jgi:hypothetical protein
VNELDYITCICKFFHVCSGYTVYDHRCLKKNLCANGNFLTVSTRYKWSDLKLHHSVFIYFCSRMLRLYSLLQSLPKKKPLCKWKFCNGTRYKWSDLKLYHSVFVYCCSRILRLYSLWQLLHKKEPLCKWKLLNGQYQKKLIRFKIISFRILLFLFTYAQVIQRKTISALKKTSVQM